MFEHISKQLEVRQKYIAMSHIFNSLLGLVKHGLLCLIYTTSRTVYISSEARSELATYCFEQDCKHGARTGTSNELVSDDKQFQQSLVSKDLMPCMA